MSNPWTPYVNPDTRKVSLPVDVNGEIDLENVPLLIVELTRLIHAWGVGTGAKR